MSLTVLLLVGTLLRSTLALRPSWDWDTVGHMAFTHTCNMSGPWSDNALDVLSKFPLVRISRPTPWPSSTQEKRNHPHTKRTVLAEIPATNPADAHSTKKSGLHQPRPSSDSPSSVTSCSTTATTPRPLARHAFDDLHGQDSVVGSDDFDY
jgi:hypothetical protein